MKILALVPEGHGYLSGAIVQVTGDELTRIAGGVRHATTTLQSLVKLGANVEINKRFDHAQDVLAEAHAAKKLPQALRAFADTLETLHPSIEDIENPPIDAEFEVKP